MFSLVKQSKKTETRLGKLALPHGEVSTPCFMPIATRGAVKNLTPEELKKLGAEIILGNTYHLWQKPGPEIIKKSGGLHKFMGWDGPILTDSGGFQVFSLAGHRKITGMGVKFSSEIDGRELFLTPEKSVEIQLALGSDIIMVLDECPPWPCSREYAEKSLKLTLNWAKRCKEYFNKKFPISPSSVAELPRRTDNFQFPNKSKIRNSKFKKINKPLLFGIVQGSVYKDLREKAVKELIKIGFPARGGPPPKADAPREQSSGWDGYAIGGVSVGEPFKEKVKVLKWVVPLLPKDKPRYLMGLGRPEEIVAATNLGIDMFDCVIPTREARHGRLYKFIIKNPELKITDKNSKFYEPLQITNSRFAKDLKPIDKSCGCHTCQNFSRAYLHHLFKIQESLGLRLATIHNLKFYLELMRQIGKNI